MSRFLFRLSRKAYCKLFSTRSRATRMQFFDRPRKPLASFKILSLCMVSLSMDVATARGGEAQHWYVCRGEYAGTQPDVVRSWRAGEILIPRE